MDSIKNKISLQDPKRLQNTNLNAQVRNETRIEDALYFKNEKTYELAVRYCTLEKIKLQRLFIFIDMFTFLHRWNALQNMLSK